VTAAAATSRLLPAWIEVILDLLPRSRPVARIPDPPEELRPLIEVARDTLGARDLSDLHARLDGHVMRLRGLHISPGPEKPGAIPEGSSATLPEQLAEDSLAAQALGLNVAGKLLRAVREADSLLPLFEEAKRDAGSPHATLLLRALSVRPWSLHDGEVVPRALVESAIVQARGAVALGALLAACVDARKPEPWLTSALADFVLLAVREAARLFASAGYGVESTNPMTSWI
jgi:hypothetical protein